MALMHVRSVLDHPLGDGQSLRPGRLPGNATFRHPGERTVFGIAQRSTMERWVARHKSFHLFEVVGVDGLLEFADFLERFHVSFELGPTRKSVETSDLELGVG